ncbi:MAG: hypothetical protein ACE141_00590 [Bryobacteraceae bacterium]
MRVLQRLLPSQAQTTGLVAVILTFAWQSTTVHYNYGGNWTALFCTGGEQRVPPLLTWERIHLFPGSRGYDGQFYHYQAHDPFLRKGLAQYVDAPRMRYRRMLVPTAAWLLAGGRDRYVDTALFAVQWMFIFLGAYWVSRYIAPLGYHPVWGLCFLLVPAALISIDRMTIDLALAALSAGFALYSRDGPPWKLWVVLACAALARETGTLLLGGYCLYLISRRLWARAMLFSSAGLPLLIWMAILGNVMREVPATHGLPERTALLPLFRTPQYTRPEALAWALTTLDYLVITGILLAALLAVRNMLTRPSTASGFAALMFALLTVLLSAIFDLHDPYSYPRLVSPMLLLVALQELPTRAWLGLLPAALLSARVGVQLGTQVVGILRGLFDG